MPAVPPARRRKLELGGSCTHVVEAISSRTTSLWQLPLFKAHCQQSMINLVAARTLFLLSPASHLSPERWAQAVLHIEELKSGLLFDESKAALSNLELDRVKSALQSGSWAALMARRRSQPSKIALEDRI